MRRGVGALMLAVLLVTADGVHADGGAPHVGDGRCAARLRGGDDADRAGRGRDRRGDDGRPLPGGDRDRAR